MTKFTLWSRTSSQMYAPCGKRISISVGVAERLAAAHQDANAKKTPAAMSPVMVIRRELSNCLMRLCRVKTAAYVVSNVFYYAVCKPLAAKR